MQDGSRRATMSPLRTPIPARIAATESAAASSWPKVTDLLTRRMPPKSTVSTGAAPFTAAASGGTSGYSTYASASPSEAATSRSNSTTVSTGSGDYENTSGEAPFVHGVDDGLEFFRRPRPGDQLVEHQPTFEVKIHEPGYIGLRPR